MVTSPRFLPLCLMSWLSWQSLSLVLHKAAAQRDVLALCLLLASHAGQRWDLSLTGSACLESVSVPPVKARWGLVCVCAFIHTESCAFCQSNCAGLYLNSSKQKQWLRKEWRWSQCHTPEMRGKTWAVAHHSFLSGEMLDAGRLLPLYSQHHLVWQIYEEDGPWLMGCSLWYYLVSAEADVWLLQSRELWPAVKTG